MRRSRAIHPIVGVLSSAVLVLSACSSEHPSHVAASSPSGVVWQHDPALRSAVGRYATYVDDQLDHLASAAHALDTAISAGDLTGARRAYGRARPYYERVEPVAEIWGSLDLRIDGRANDFVRPSRFVGFHRIEQLLWTSGHGAPTAATLVAARTVAADADANVARLRTLARAVDYTPLELTSGATELLDEIQASKVTGDEERYSHIDLVDFAANVDGVREVVQVFTPALRSRDPELLATITTRSHQLDAGLARFRAQPGYDGTGFVRFTTVTTAQRRTLAGLVQALAESVALLTGALT
ncbi:MAG TPA: EfeM/EfeO family lipoprotein [Jatrophihabitantaceae bacterium]